ncbi:hypothetical protein SeMB42_g03105 [Synchytrium endobioticum]|uniref:Cilia- and flagella-associated protein 69 ARM repeats domain-containing protein n=1 Tax=Synchytrium endobioticum TaxID=286115 RepID=A0A507D964_9FUNG|nr:hypothetical protein SeLEV6574_g06318 [Synchytrium endobioticum]TPX48179.1 hypothetical protein SeMB42_g03105 [Synchytrium endobioticum]
MESIRLPPLPLAKSSIMPSFANTTTSSTAPNVTAAPSIHAISATSNGPVKAHAPPIQKHVDYDKIIHAFATTPYGPPLYDRYSTVIDRLTRICNDSGGIASLAEFEPLTRVLNLLRVDVLGRDSGSEIVGDVRRLLGALGNALLQHSEHDMSAHASALARFVDEVGAYIDLQLDELVEVAADIVNKVTGKQGEYGRADAAYHYICLEPQPKSPEKKGLALVHKDGTSGISGLVLLPCVESSRIAPRLLQALQKASTLSCEWKILRALRKLSAASAVCCEQLVQDGQIAFLCECAARLPDESLVATAVEVLFNGLIEGDLAPQSAAILGSPDCIRDLTTIYERLVRKEYSKPDEHLRNELLLLLTKIAEKCPDSIPHFAETGFISLSCSTLLAGKVFAKGNQPSLEDFQLWKLSIRNLMVLCTDDMNLSKALVAGLLKFAFAYLQEDQSVRFGWSKTQLKEIQILILGMLTALIPRMIAEFRPKEGARRTLNFLAWAIKCDSGLQKDASGMPQEILGVVPATLKLLLAIAELGVAYKKDLGSSGVFIHVIYLLKNFSTQIPLVYNAMVLSSTLCQGSKANKILFGESGGVSALIPYLKYDSPNPKLHNKVLVGSVECIWMCISGCHASEEEFLSGGGMFMILDRMETTAQPLKKHIMGCVLDLLENQKARSHVLEWRSVADESRGIAHLLIDMWTEEERVLGVPEGRFGVLADLEDPLYSQAYARDANNDSVAISEISLNMRAKVYSMFTKLGFDPFYDVLSPEQRIKLLLIAKYLDFKLGEVWEEICNELDHEGVRPVTPDLECVQISKQVQIEKSQVVQQRQLELVKKKTEGDFVKERTFLQEKITQIHTRQR